MSSNGAVSLDQNTVNLAATQAAHPSPSLSDHVDPQAGPSSPTSPLPPVYDDAVADHLKHLKMLLDSVIANCHYPVCQHYNHYPSQFTYSGGH